MSPGRCRPYEKARIWRRRRTGRKGLFISTGVLRRAGITEADGQGLPPFLLAHASSPNYTVFGWHPGDFVFWDNRATRHYAVTRL